MARKGGGGEREGAGRGGEDSTYTDALGHFAHDVALGLELLIHPTTEDKHNCTGQRKRCHCGLRQGSLWSERSSCICTIPLSGSMGLHIAPFPCLTGKELLLIRATPRVSGEQDICAATHKPQPHAFYHPPHCHSAQLSEHILAI